MDQDRSKLILDTGLNVRFQKLKNITKIPFCLKQISENILISGQIGLEDILSFYLEYKVLVAETMIKPNHLIFQDFTGLPALMDLAYMRQEIGAKKFFDPLCYMDFVLDSFLHFPFAKETLSKIKALVSKTHILSSAKTANIVNPLPYDSYNSQHIILPLPNLQPSVQFGNVPVGYSGPPSLFLPVAIPTQFALYPPIHIFPFETHQYPLSLPGCDFNSHSILRTNSEITELAKIYDKSSISPYIDAKSIEALKKLTPQRNKIICFGPNIDTQQADVKNFEVLLDINNETDIKNDSCSSNDPYECMICKAPPPSGHSKRYLQCPLHNTVTLSAPLLLRNHELEFERNKERLAFLKWCSLTFKRTRVIAPGSGISHSTNLEYLARFVVEEVPTSPINLSENDLENSSTNLPPLLRPDVIVGTDSHIAALNGLGILAWGVGGIDAQSVLLGQPIAFPFCSNNRKLRIFGVRIIGIPDLYVTSTDIVLNITKVLRSRPEIQGHILEFCGPSLKDLVISDRLTLANMCPEYGAAISYFPFDQTTAEYLINTGRPIDEVRKIQKYMKAMGFFRTDNDPEPVYSEVIEIDLSRVRTCVSGPKRPQEKASFENGKCELISLNQTSTFDTRFNELLPQISDGDLLLAAITSCSNSTNPRAMLMAGLLAKRACENGLKLGRLLAKSSCEAKNSDRIGSVLLTPGGSLSIHYLKESLTLPYLKRLGFEITGYGCPDCDKITQPSVAQNVFLKQILDIEEIEATHNLTVNNSRPLLCALLSGNRNYEPRELPHPRAIFLASPALVVAYALAGTINFDFHNRPLNVNYASNQAEKTTSHEKNEIEDLTEYQYGKKGVYLRDIWPSREQISEAENKLILPAIFNTIEQSMKLPNDDWLALNANEKREFWLWDAHSTYIKEPPRSLFVNLNIVNTQSKINIIQGARTLAIFGDHVTSDHISPAGSIPRNTPAAKYLTNMGLSTREFNSYGSRRGNHEVMSRGTFANPKLKNLILVNHLASQSTKVPPQANYPQQNISRKLPNYNHNNNNCMNVSSCSTTTTNAKLKATQHHHPQNFTVHYPSSRIDSIYDVAQLYAHHNIPTICIAGTGFGSGSIREWATRGPRLLGVRAFIAVSFDPVYRSNLIAMGILPLAFTQSENATKLRLKGDETYDISFESAEDVHTLLENESETSASQRFAFKPNQMLIVRVSTNEISTIPKNGEKLTQNFKVELQARSKLECLYLSYGGLLPYVMANHTASI